MTNIEFRMTNPGPGLCRVFMALALLIVTASAAGGPDRGGYRWTDSDSAGGPAFNWIDISGSGTALPLGDDDNSGPLGLGFSFPFYTSAVESVCICSNGWLSFTSNSHQFHHYPMPDPQDPNAVAAGLWTDLDPAAGGSVRYLADTASGRFVAAWLGVPFHESGDTCSFEVVFDSTGTILFQYLHVPAADEPGIDSCSVGIEDAAGSAGSQYLYDDAPVANRLHDSLAVRFYRLDHDVCPTAVLRPDTSVLYDQRITPLVKIWNAGLDTASFDVTLRIGAGYGDAVHVAGLNGLRDTAVAFPPWVAELGTQPVSVVTALGGDQWPANDTLVTVTTVDRDGELRYDDGIADTTFIRNGAPTSDWAAAVRFLAPNPQLELLTARIYVGDTLPFARVLLCPDSSGLPGVGQAWFEADSVHAAVPNSWLEIPVGQRWEDTLAWLVAFWPRRATGPAIGEDRSAPRDSNSWYGSPTVRWLRYTTGDLMARLAVAYTPGVEEHGLTTGGTRIAATVVRGVLNLQLTVCDPQSAFVLLDAAGRKVMTLQPGENDVSRLEPGVYFIRETGNRKQRAVRKVLIVR
jgi:hypothetical protein